VRAGFPSPARCENFANQHYYHPAQQGKWGRKSVLPTLGGGADQSQLEGVAEGQMAADAYFEATEPDATPARKEELRHQLLTYCHLDTWAMVRLWAEKQSPGQPRG
jgi:hypothetical protein